MDGSAITLDIIGAKFHLLRSPLDLSFQLFFVDYVILTVRRPMYLLKARRARGAIPPAILQEDRMLRPATRTITVLPILFAIIGFFGCHDKPKVSSAPEVIVSSAPEVVIVVDTSPSTSGMRTDQISAVDQIYQRCTSAHEPLTIFALGTQADILWGPRIPTEELLTNYVLYKLRNPVKKDGTRPALLWEAMAEEYGASQKSAFICYSTDGDNDFPEDKARLQTAIKRLGANQNVHIILTGVNPENKGWLGRLFLPVFGARFAISGRSEMIEAAKSIP
jgi:hypothetical protein